MFIPEISTFWSVHSHLHRKELNERNSFELVSTDQFDAFQVNYR